jgi:hypothetical protein
LEKRINGGRKRRREKREKNEGDNEGEGEGKKWNRGRKKKKKTQKQHSQNPMNAPRNRLLQIRVLKHYIRGLTPQFQGYFLEVRIG